MTLNDLRWFFMPLFGFEKLIGLQERLYNNLYSESRLSAYDYSHHNVPVVIIAGDCDWITPITKLRSIATVFLRLKRNLF